jgi:hypothetical protein
MFSNHFKIQSFTSVSGLKFEIDEISNHEIIKVIAAASLDDNDKFAYSTLQN